MRRFVWCVGIAVTALFASGQGCANTILGELGGGGTGGGTGGTYIGCGGGCDGTWSDGGGDGSDGVGVYPSCYECACQSLSGDALPGCADICDNTISGAATPNFCNGTAALSQCTACIASRCGSDPASCY